MKSCDEKYEILVLLRHYWKKGLTAAAAVREICEIEGEGVIKLRKAQLWFKNFNGGNSSLSRKKGSGRPFAGNSEALRAIVESNPCISTRQLSAAVGPSQSSIVRHLKKINKVNRRCREVPHELTPNNIQRRIEICRNLLQNPLDERFFKRIVTCDEKWIYFHNENNQNQWLDQSQPAIPVVRRGRFDKKIMLCVWWNFQGIIHFELIQNGLAITSEVYSQQLDRMYVALYQKYPALINRKRALLLQDNAKPHTAKQTKEKLEELDGIELLPHPAYSPDLAPSDYYLFRSMAHFLKGRRFNNEEEVKNGCQEFFASKDEKWYKKGIELLAEKWLKTINHNGLYFEE